MKTVSLDVHTEASQLYAVNEGGEVLLEMKLATDIERLREVIEGIPGPKRLVFEEGPLSGWLRDGLGEVVDKVIACDPSHNGVIARAENSNDEHDARWLNRLDRLESIREVFIAPEPYRTLRSLLAHDERLSSLLTGVRSRIKALCRRQGIRYRGAEILPPAGRPPVLRAISSKGLRWQMRSLYRLFDSLGRERLAVAREKKALTRGMPEVQRMQSAPGTGPITAETTVAMVVDPERFPSRSKLNAYAGYGLGQGFTDWKPVGKSKASRRGNRPLKRVLGLAAMATLRGENALERRYRIRQQMGWPHSKAIRDVARHLLWILCAIWRTGAPYDDTKAGMDLDKLRR
jgi:transposase